MINKLQLNNHIISNKKKIEQARVQTINKLVQKIRKLKNLSKKHVDKARIDANLKRVVLILGCVKRLKPADAIRRVLTLHKKPLAVLTNGQAIPEDVAVALLASNKIIDDIVKFLRTNFHLNDTNPGWKEEIMELSKKKKLLLKNSGQKKQNKNSPKTNAQSRKPSWKEEVVNSEPTDGSDAEDYAVQNSFWKVESVDDILEEPITKTEEAVTELEANKSTTQVSPPIAKKTGSTIDSFFFTITGENYMSPVVFKRKQPEAPKDGLVRRERRRNQRSSFQRQDHHKKPSFNTRRSDDRQGYSFWKEKQIPRHNNLHPSWAAKKKMKAGIIEFTGRKIRFEDESKSKSSAKSAEKRSSKSHTPAHEPDQNAEKLHPSWAAKQKLKPSIKTFKGTKIKFDD